MKLTRFTKTTACAAAAGFTLLAISLISGARPASAQNDRNGEIHIVKDCSQESGVPGTDFCEIVSSNLPELPAGTRIHYDLNAGPDVGAHGYFDQNIFVYVSDSQWAVGRCTGPNDLTEPNKTALCTLSDGMGRLAGISTRMVVTYTPGGDGGLFAWDGTYSFKSLPQR